MKDVFEICWSIEDFRQTIKEQHCKVAGDCSGDVECDDALRPEKFPVLVLHRVESDENGEDWCAGHAVLYLTGEIAHALCDCKEEFLPRHRRRPTTVRAEDHD